MRIPNMTTMTLLASFFPISAAALNPCDQVVVDTAGVLKNIPGIEAAAVELAELTGADIRVRVEPDHGSYRSIDGHVENIADTVCADQWSNDVASGDRYSNLIIYWVTMNRQIGIYYGDSWANELDRTWRGVMDSKMKPSLRDGNFDRAFIRGIEETQLVIERARTPSAPVTIVSEPRVDREPIDPRPLIYVLGGLAAAAMLFFALQYVLNYLGRMRQAKQQAHTAWTGAYGQFTKLEDIMRRLKAAIGEDADVSWVHPRLLSTWRRQFELLLSDYASDSTSFQMSEEEQFREVGTVEEFAEVRNMLTALLERFTKHTENLLRLETEIFSQKDLHASFVTDKAEALASHSKTGASLLFREAEGFIVASLSEQLAAAKISVVQAQRHFDDKEYDKAREKLTEAEDQTALVQKTSDGLPARKAGLLLVHTQLIDRYKASGTFVQQAHEDYDAMFRQFAQVCYESVVGNGSEAEIRLKEVPAMLESVQQLLDSQDWDEADSMLTETMAFLAGVSGLLESVSQLRQRLETDRVEAQAEIDEADRSINVARAYLRDNPHDTDVARHRSNLSNAAVRLKQARELMAVKKPNVIAALKAASAADQIADEAYALAVQDQDQAKRKREMAERLRKEAVAALTTAKRYHQNHHGDVKSAARAKLSEAERLLKDMERANDVDVIIGLAQAASQRAETSLKRAKSDHSSAESSRAAARRRRQQPPPSSSFGGGSSSFGSSSGFGGGSSGFGGGGGFGGGSSGW